MSMKNSRDTIGNRTRDLPACSAVPQPTLPFLKRKKKQRTGISNHQYVPIISFGAESFVFHFAIQFKDEDIQKDNFAYCFVWV
jgi:hypothetical protein